MSSLRGGLCVLVVLSGCRVGIHTYQARTSGERTLHFEPDSTVLGAMPEDRMGTAELSERLRGFDAGFLIIKKPWTLELGATLGTSNPRTGTVTGEFPIAEEETRESGWHPEDLSVYDALYVGATFPLTTIDDVKIRAYGRASLITFARLVRTSSGPTSMLDGGIEFAMPFSESGDIYLRFGYQLERVDLYYEIPYDGINGPEPGTLTGSDTFFGFTAGLGVYWSGSD